MSTALLPTVLDILRREEGTRAKVYDDATGKAVVPGYTMKGHPTIGVGRALDVRGIDDGEINFLLENDINGLMRKVPTMVPNWGRLSTNRQAVLVCMAFQMGVAGLASFKATLKAVSEGMYETAAANMLKSLWAKQTPARVQRMAELMRRG